MTTCFYLLEGFSCSAHFFEGKIIDPYKKERFTFSQ